MKYIPSVFIPLFISLGTTIIYGNFLSPDEYGQYNIFLTTINMGYTMFFSFINLSILRLYNEYKIKKEEIKLISTFINALFISLLIISIIIRIYIKNSFLYFLISFINIIFTNFIVNFYRAKEDIFKYNLMKILPPLVTIFYLVYYIFNEKLNLYSVILSANLPCAIISIIIILKYYFNGKIKFILDIEIFRKSLSFGFPLIIINLLNLVISSSDKYFIEYYLGYTEVGFYSFGYRIAELIMINITMLLIIAIYPKLIQLYEDKNYIACSNTLKHYLNIHFIVITPIIFLFFLFSTDLIKIFFKQYIGAENVLNFIAIGTYCYSLTMYTNKSFELSKKTFALIRVLIFTCLANIILNVMLIPSMGINGAIVSTILSYLIYILYSIYISNKIFKINIDYKVLIFIIICNFFIFILIKNIKLTFSNGTLISIILLVITYCLIYIGILYLIHKWRKKYEKFNEASKFI